MKLCRQLRSSEAGTDPAGLGGSVGNNAISYVGTDRGEDQCGGGDKKDDQKKYVNSKRREERGKNVGGEE